MTQQINGNTEGIRNSLLEQIRDLYQLRMEADTFAPPPMLLSPWPASPAKLAGRSPYI